MIRNNNQALGNGVRVEAKAEYNENRLLRLGKALLPGWVESGIDFAGYFDGRRFSKWHLI